MGNLLSYILGWSNLLTIPLEHHKVERVPFWLGLRRSQIRNPFTKNKKLPNKNKQETQIHSQNIQIYASSQFRLTQALYQTRYE